MYQAERMANEAVYILQLNTREAVRYVQRNAQVGEELAAKTLKSVVDWARKQK